MSRAPRVVRAFVDVRKGEVEPAVLFFFLWFLIIVVFQILKPLKSGFFVESLGAYIELYAKLANIGVALAAVILFTALYNRLGSRLMIATLCAGFGGALLLFAAVLRGGEPGTLTNWFFYLFGDAWSTIWVTTFWAYLNEMTRTEQSKRLYGVIGGGGVVGGLFSGVVVWLLVEPVGAAALLAGCAAVTLLLGMLVWRLEVLGGRGGAPIGRTDTTRIKVEAEDKKMNAAVEGAKLVTASKYLAAIVGTIFLYELVSQILDYQYKTAAEALEGAGATQAFFGQVTAIIGVVSVITQFFLVSFIIRKLGITVALLVLPMAMALASGAYMIVPVLWTAAMLTVSDNAFSYSINQTSRETLFMVTSSDVKYKARAFGNMFVQRFGKGVAILMALALVMVPIRFLSVLAIVVIVIWAGFAIYAGRRFDGLTAGPEISESDADEIVSSSTVPASSESA